MLDLYFVKLFNRRWYGLVKFPEPTALLFTLAFDRILSLEVTDEKFEYNKDFDFEEGIFPDDFNWSTYEHEKAHAGDRFYHRKHLAASSGKKTK